MMDWQPIETAPKDCDILVYRGGRQYVARWRDIYRTWGVSAERVPGEVETFTDVGDIGFAGSYAARKPTHWMPLPEPPSQ